MRLKFWESLCVVGWDVVGGRICRQEYPRNGSSVLGLHFSHLIFPALSSCSPRPRRLSCDRVKLLTREIQASLRWQEMITSQLDRIRNKIRGLVSLYILAEIDKNSQWNEKSGKWRIPCREPWMFHLDQRSEGSVLFLLLKGYDRSFDPESGCTQDAWPRVWSLHVLPKQQNT